MRRIIFVLSFCFLAFFLSPLVRAGDDWQPISPEELRMISEPKAPGASAIYLYRQVDRDDVKFREIDYARIKIFTDEGRKYADVEIPYVKGFGSIKGSGPAQSIPMAALSTLTAEYSTRWWSRRRECKYW
jgi:hypothetical protein